MQKQIVHGTQILHVRGGYKYECDCGACGKPHKNYEYVREQINNHHLEATRR